MANLSAYGTEFTEIDDEDSTFVVFDMILLTKFRNLHKSSSRSRARAGRNRRTRSTTVSWRIYGRLLGRILHDCWYEGGLDADTI
jgi:hypothetical protein